MLLRVDIPDFRADLAPLSSHGSQLPPDDAKAQAPCCTPHFHLRIPYIFFLVHPCNSLPFNSTQRPHPMCTSCLSLLCALLYPRCHP